MTVRNLLYSPTLAELRKNYKVRIISYYADQLTRLIPTSSGTITFTNIQEPRWNMPQCRGWFSRILEDWEYHALWQSHQPATQRRFMQKRKNLKPLKYLFDSVGGWVTKNARWNSDRDFIRDIAYTIPVRRQFSGINAVFLSSTDLPKDKALAYSCKKAGIPTIVLVHSWDVLPARGLISTRPDRLLVWSEHMAKDAINIHNVPEGSIDIVGGPQFEAYRLLAKQTDESFFRARFKIPERNYIITYTCNVGRVFPEEPLFLEKLVDRVTAGIFGDVSLIIRLHPTDAVRSKEYKTKYLDETTPVRFDLADDNFAAENTGLVGAQDSIVRFVELMQYSDIVINVGSTITLDAAIHDTPIICPNIQFSKPSHPWDSIDLRYRNNHTQIVAKSGAVSLPKTMEELTDDILIALQRPHDRKSDRAKLVDKLVPNLPTARLIGKSLEKVL